MNNVLIKTYYLEFIDKEIKNYDDKTRHHVHDFAKSIINFVIDYDHPESLKELDYSMIKNIVDSEDVVNIQYTLHLLALKPHNVLDWVFYVENEEDDTCELTRIYLKPKQITEILGNKSFHNPITGKAVTKQKFSELVNTVFKVSDDFLVKLSQSDAEGCL